MAENGLFLGQKMIRNYQRAGGSSVDLAPIYNSLNALQNEVNSLITVTKLTSIASDISVISALSSSVTDISTAFTSHTSLYDWKFRTLSSSVTNMNESIMSINAVISTLSTATGGGGKTITNPTESGYVFTDPVLYTGPDIEAPGGQTFNNAYNTYLKGVTWSDYPSTVTESPYRTLPAYFGGCVVYGDLSFVNVYAWEIESCTVEHVKIHSCVTGMVSNGSYTDVSVDSVSLMMAYGTINSLSANNADAMAVNSATCNSIQLSQCNRVGLNGIYVNHLYVPDVSELALSHCRVKDLLIDYPSTVTSYDSNRFVTLDSNTIDRMNASLLRYNAKGNDIWTANIYMDYDLMQSAVLTSAGYLHANTINELSIFNNDHGTGNTTNQAISQNGLYLGNNSIRHLYNDLYIPVSLWSNTIDTLANTLGVSLSARGNSIEEWDCEVSPYSALRYGATRSFALISSNHVARMNFSHDFTDESLFTTDSSSSVMNNLNKLTIYLLQNSASYVSCDVLNPITANFKGAPISAQFNVANSITFAVSESIGTLNMVKNERFDTTPREAEIRAISAHSMGMTNVYPRFVAAGESIDLLNIYLDGPMKDDYTLRNISASSVSFKNFASMSTDDSWLYVFSCSFGFFEYVQSITNRLGVMNDSISYCSITGGNLNAYTCDFTNLNININAANIAANNMTGLGGTVRWITLNTNNLTLGGFYYGTSSGASNTIVRLNTGL